MAAAVFESPLKSPGHIFYVPLRAQSLSAPEQLAAPGIVKGNKLHKSIGGDRSEKPDDLFKAPVVGDPQMVDQGKPHDSVTFDTVKEG